MLLQKMLLQVTHREKLFLPLISYSEPKSLAFRSYLCLYSLLLDAHAFLRFIYYLADNQTKSLWKISQVNQVY